MKTILKYLLGCVIIALISLAMLQCNKPIKTQEKLSNKEYKIVTIKYDSLTLSYIK